MEPTVGSAEGEQPVAFDTGVSAPTCEALVALVQSGDRHTLTTCPKHQLLLPESLELETQIPSVCGCDKLQTGPTRECTKWRIPGALSWGVETILCQRLDRGHATSAQWARTTNHPFI